MAYVKQDEDDPTQQGAQPSVAAGNGSGGGFSSGGGGTGYTQAARPSTTNQETPQQQAGSGTGFTNLSSWLDAGKGRDQNITDTGNSTLAGVASDFTKAFQPTYDGATSWHPETMTDGDAKSLLGSAAGGDQGAFDKLGGWLNQSYSGPGPMSFDLSQNTDSTGHRYSSNAGINKVDQLGNADTAGTALAGNQQYSAGDKRMDSILFGTDPASRDAMGSLNSATDTFTTNAGKAQDKVNEIVAGDTQGATDASAAARTQLEGIGGGLLQGLTDRVTAANKQSQNDQTNGVVRDPATGQTEKMPAGYKIADWEGAAPNSANAGNMVTGTESKEFGALRRLLGDDKYNITQSGTPYKEGYNALTADPDQEGTLKVTPDPAAVASSDSLAKANAGKQPDINIESMIGGVGSLFSPIGIIQAIDAANKQHNIQMQGPVLGAINDRNNQLDQLRNLIRGGSK